MRETKTWSEIEVRKFCFIFCFQEKLVVEKFVENENPTVREENFESIFGRVKIDQFLERNFDGKFVEKKKSPALNVFDRENSSNDDFNRTLSSTITAELVFNDKEKGKILGESFESGAPTEKQTDGIFNRVEIDQFRERKFDSVFISKKEKQILTTVETEKPPEQISRPKTEENLFHKIEIDQFQERNFGVKRTFFYLFFISQIFVFRILKVSSQKNRQNRKSKRKKSFHHRSKRNP